MKLINKVFNIITIYLITTAIVAFMWSFLGDYLSEIKWFNDYSNNIKSGWDQTYTHWGARHCIFMWFNVLMFCTSTARVIFNLISIVEEDK